MKDLTPGLYLDQAAYELERYLDWHRRHPHCISPRPRDAEVGEKMTGQILVDEEDPNLVYTRSPGKLPPVPKEFQAPQLGVDCDTDEVSTIAMKSEYKKVIAYITEYDDPW